MVSGALTPSIYHPDSLCLELARLCESTRPIELFEHLVKTLHAFTQGQPIALYRRLRTGSLRLAYYYPLENSMASHNTMLSLRCDDDLVASGLQLYELMGEHDVWGYIGHPPATYGVPSQWVRLLVDIASQRLRLLKAQSMAARRLSLKHRRRLLSKDIKRFTSIDAILQHHSASWCDIFQADGIALCYQENLHCFGDYPPKHHLFQQRLQLNKKAPHDDILELYDECQGGLAARLSLANTHLGWLMLFRKRPLIAALTASEGVQTAVSYWLPLEASMIAELADDLTVAITAQEVVHLNHQLTRANQRLENLAHTDPLTKCWNRYYTELILEGLSQSTINFAILMFDIDDFKNINDTYGHAVGDDILRDIARLVQGTLRTNDHLGRWGGEEFIIIAKELSQETSLQLANRLCHSVEQHAFPVTRQVTISLGLTLAQPGEQPRQLLERVDQGMYLAKTAGKNQVILC
nr:sensor domain-containing diguanylate cyclase [Halomonas sp.]